MNDSFRLDTEEMLRLSRSLTKLRDELDTQAQRLRLLQRLTDVPLAADDALRYERRRISSLMENLSALFEENEAYLRRRTYTEIGVFRGGLNHSFPKSSISSVWLSGQKDV